MLAVLAVSRSCHGPARVLDATLVSTSRNLARQSSIPAVRHTHVNVFDTRFCVEPPEVGDCSVSAPT